MVEVLVRQKIDSDETLGTFIDSKYYDRVIDSDCDLYGLFCGDFANKPLF